jgi:hypothetical protein
MELLALLAISLMAIIGWGVTKAFFGKWVDPDDRFYFAPAVGMGACAVVAYLAAATRQTWCIPIFTVSVLAAFLRNILKKQARFGLDANSWRLLRVTVLTLLCLYGMQISLFQFFKAIYPGPHEVWDLFNLSGVPPPDQMFAWHQAMFADLHRHYPQDPFYGVTDLYDRPQLGGYLTLFFFKLFHLPLTEDHFSYPAQPLRFYHSLWWLMNNLYLLGVAPLFRRLFGFRGAILAVASTATGGFFLLCNVGGWMKFSSSYPFLLAVLLFLNGKGPVLQALLCVVSYYIHGSALPFLVGFGLLQVLSLYYPIRLTPSRFKDVTSFGLLATTLVGAWFLVVKLVGSKQPLLYYYIYGAGIDQAQTEPVTEIAKAFYAQYSWSNLSLLPLHNLTRSIFPIHFFDYVRSVFFFRTPFNLTECASMIFQSQRYCIWSGLGLVALPIVFTGFIKTLFVRSSGRIILCVYLIPSLLMALLYRIPWSFSLHIMCLYQAFILFLWVFVMKNTRLRFIALGLVAISVEGVICVLFSDMRFIPVHGIHLEQITGMGFVYLGGYLTLLAGIVAIACRELRNLPPETETAPPFATKNRLIGAAGKLLVGLLIIALTIASYSVYCLRFY